MFNVNAVCMQLCLGHIFMFKLKWPKAYRQFANKID